MKIRILISSTDNRELYIAVTERLMRATRENPENWETVVGVPGVIDHVGHKTDTFSRVVWSREYDGGPLFRLTIRDDHPVYDDLAALIADELVPVNDRYYDAESMARDSMAVAGVEFGGEMSPEVNAELKRRTLHILRSGITRELLELSKQVLNDHGIRDAMPGDPGSIAQLTVALRSLIKAVES